MKIITVNLRLYSSEGVLFNIEAHTRNGQIAEEDGAGNVYRITHLDKLRVKQLSLDLELVIKKHLSAVRDSFECIHDDAILGPFPDAETFEPPRCEFEQAAKEGREP